MASVAMTPRKERDGVRMPLIVDSTPFLVPIAAAPDPCWDADSESAPRFAMTKQCDEVSSMVAFYFKFCHV